MRVAISVETFLPKIDGIVVAACLTLDYLLQYDIETLLFAPGQGVTNYKGIPIVGVHGFTNPKYPEGRISIPTYGTIKALRDFKPDLVHVLDPAFIGAGVGIASKWMGIPTIASYHLDFAQVFKDFGLGLLSYPVSKLRLWGFNYVDHALAPSRRAQKTLEIQGVRRVGWWRRGVDSTNFHPRFRQDEMRVRLTDGHPERVILLYVGRLSNGKGIPNFKPILERVPNVHLALVGDGPQRAEFQELFAGLPVSFVGYMKDETLSSAYASSDMFVFASEHESFGMVLAEAAASAIPVVSSRVGGAEDVIQHSESGFIYEIGDIENLTRYVGELARDMEKRRQFGERARRHAESLNWPDIMRDFVYFYEDILREKGVDPRLTPADRPPSPLYKPIQSRALASAQQ